MRIPSCIAAIGLLVLAACGSPDSKGGDESPAPKGSASGAQVRLEPGEWEMAVEMSGEGMPAAVAAAMKGQRVTSRTCITPEQANSPRGDMFSGKRNDNCSKQEFSMTGGRLRSSATCKAPGGSGEVTLAMEGQYEPRSFDVTMTMTGAGVGGGSGKSATRLTGRRIGECPAGKAG